MNGKIEIQSEIHDDCMIIKLIGRIDHITAPHTEEKLKELLQQAGEKVILDLEGLNYISSVGLRVLVMFANKIERINGRLVLCSPAPNISNLLKMTKFDEFFVILDTQKDAIHALR